MYDDLIKELREQDPARCDVCARLAETGGKVGRDMSKRKIVRNADEACNILKSLMETPQLVSLHFEFDIGVDRSPMVDYRIKRFALGFTEEAEEAEK